MKIAVYGRTETARVVADVLYRAGHRVMQRTDKFFGPTDVEAVDAAVVVESHRKADIITGYLKRGLPAFTVDRDEPDLPGYPVATFRDHTLIDTRSWDFIDDPVPNAYQNPEEGRLVCCYYPGAPIETVQRNEMPKKFKLPSITTALHSNSLSEAPRVWILAGGPSLRGFDFGLLKNEMVIGVNRAFEQNITGINVTMDDRFIQWTVDGQCGINRDRWDDFPGLKIYTGWKNGDVRQNNLLYVQRERDEDNQRPTLESIGTCSNSGYAAVKIACALGAKHIYLLGFDMQGVNGKSAHYHGDYPNLEDASIYEKYRQQMDAAAPGFAAQGVNVLVCGDSALKAYKTITLEDVAAMLRYKPQRPQVCCFYTEGTPYLHEAQEMARSARAFGLDTRCIAAPNLGDWKANTDQKPGIIEQALREIDGPIAFVDADARFRAYPALFDEFCASKAEIGLSHFNWDAFPADSRKGRELSSAVMLLKPTKRVYSLLSKWARATTTSGTMWEQRVLQDIIEAESKKRGPKLKAMEIPMRYNQIYDSMKSLGQPVIEQLQASRRLKAAV